jgi:hypothetical protein
MNADGAVIQSSTMTQPIPIPKVFDLHGAYRLGSYLTIWISYLIFMGA